MSAVASPVRLVSEVWLLLQGPEVDEVGARLHRLRGLGEEARPRRQGRVLFHVEEAPVSAVASPVRLVSEVWLLLQGPEVDEVGALATRHRGVGIQGARVPHVGLLAGDQLVRVFQHGVAGDEEGFVGPGPRLSLQDGFQLTPLPVHFAWVLVKEFTKPYY